MLQKPWSFGSCDKFQKSYDCCLSFDEFIVWIGLSTRMFNNNGFFPIIVIYRLLKDYVGARLCSLRVDILEHQIS